MYINTVSKHLPFLEGGNIYLECNIKYGNSVNIFLLSLVVWRYRVRNSSKNVNFCGEVDHVRAHA